MSLRTSTSAVWICALALALTPACKIDDHGEPAGDGGTAATDAFIPDTFPFIELLASPTGPVTGLAVVRYRLHEMAGVPADVAATWLTPSTLPLLATPGAGTNLQFGIDATPEGVDLTFAWDSAADFPADIDAAEICLQATSTSGTSDLVCTAPFDVRNAIPGGDGLRINEVLTGSEDAAELVNNGTATVDLLGFTFLWTDESGLSGLLPIDVSYPLDPGARVLLRENSAGAVPGVLYLGENISWSNATGGSAELIDLVGRSMDFVRWGGSAQGPTGGLGWSETATLPTPPDDTTSLSRIGATDTDGDADFCLTLGTPGDANGPCLTLAAYGPGDLTITEISTAPLDWVEVVNTSGSTANLLGVRLEWSSMLGFGVVVLPNVDIPAGGRFVVTDNAGTSGATTFVGPDNFAWSPFAGGGSAAFVDSYGDGIDFVQWGALDPAGPPTGVTWDDAAGAAPVVADSATLTRSPETTDTDTPQDFCVAAPTMNAPNGPCLPDGSAADLLITEISCGAPDWVEVANVGAADVDLTGWALVWSRPGGFTGGGGGAPAGVLSMPSYLLAAGERVVIADGDTGVANQIAFSGTMGMNISWGMPSGWSGAAAMYDPYGNAEDYLRWGTSTAMTPAGTSWTETGGGVAAPASDDDHLNRDESLGDNDADTDWCVVTPGTLGLPNDPCP